MNINESLYGFAVTERHRIPELSADLYVLRHRVSGARLVFIDREDENKTFSISFRTTPSDSTGVFHILEHSVLCGSEKFPVKDPFVELLKGSLNTFLNAMTFQDKTMYPVSSRNDKDFLNLVDIYMDAVLHPLAVKDPNAFYQEGWHYELDEKTGKLSYKGVVLNEMRGDYSSPESQADRHLNAMLYPDTCYGEDSGGDPEEIIKLTYEDFKAAHKKYYHPSGAEIFLDGSVDLDSVLPLLDSYLREYEKRDGSETEKIKFQPKIPSGKRVIEYEISDGEDTKDKTRVLFGRIFTRFDDKERLLCAGILFSSLFSNNESPAKAAIIESGLCEDVTVTLRDGILEPSVIVEFINVRDGREGEAWEIFERVISKIAKDGIDKSLILASLNAMEFKLRERDYGSLPLGVVNAMISLESLLYSDDPMQNLCYEDSLAAIRSLPDGYYEKLLSDIFLAEGGMSTLIMHPSATLGEERKKKEDEMLENVARGMSNEEKTRILKENAELLLWQETPDTAEKIAKIPRLQISDISDKIKDVKTEEISASGVRVLFHDVDTRGIVYTDFYFDISDIEKDDLPYLLLMSSLLTNLPTKSHTALEIQSLIKANLGSFDVKMTALTRGDEPKIYLQVSVSALASAIDSIVSLTREILNETQFDDDSAIRNFIRQTVILGEESLVSAGHQVALGRASAATSVEAAVREYHSGYEAHVLIKELDADFDNLKEDIKARFSRLLSVSVCRERLTVSLTGEVDESLAERLASVADGGGEVASVCKIQPLPFKKEGILIPAQIAFSALSYNLCLLGEEPTGSFDVVRQIVGYEYLWGEIRVKGGAYGAGMVAGISGNIGFYSYRDPTPERSIRAYRQIPDFLRKFAEEGDVAKYVIGAVGDSEPIRTPRMTASLATVRYLRGISYERRLAIRRALLNTDKDELLRIADILEKCISGAAVTIVGGKDKLEGAQLDVILKR